MDDENPEIKEYIFFDIELYVPPKDRVSANRSLVANPYKLNHLLLGGVFCRSFPLKNNKMDLEQFWVWKDGDEEKTLKKIYQFFNDSWKMIEGKSDRPKNLVFVGIGICRFDIPVLFARSIINKIDTQENLYHIYHKSQHVDLSEVGIPFFDTLPTNALYPKSTGLLMKRWGISEERESGQTVWEMYDKKEYPQIQQRTENEVRNIIRIYNSMKNHINNKAAYKSKTRMSQR